MYFTPLLAIPLKGDPNLTPISVTAGHSFVHPLHTLSLRQALTGNSCIHGKIGCMHVDVRRPFVSFDTYGIFMMVVPIPSHSPRRVGTTQHDEEWKDKKKNERER